MSALEALQSTLAGEHATLYTYGVLGARTSESASPALYLAVDTAYRQHRARRDHLRTLVAEAGGQPVAAEPAYSVDGALLRPAQVAAAALALESESCTALTALVAQTSGAVRQWALTEAVRSATWQLQLGGGPSTWPGAPELS